MMISRIKEIKNIGTFSNFTNGASLGFEKLTFIYGYNTFGKTTLADIFQSLKFNIPTPILSRKTIPHQTCLQKVVISQKEEAESDITFLNNNWSTNHLGSCLEVFGTDFIHKNLFTGLTIERGNRENFTQFVLGEQGVKLADQIAGKRKTFSDCKRELKTLIPQYVRFKNDTEIDKFITFSVDKLDIDQIKSDLLLKATELQSESKRLKEPQEILSLSEPNQFTLPEIDTVKAIKAINVLLENDYSEIKDDILKKIAAHLSDNFSDLDGAEKWIKDGLHYCEDKKSCSFCGQSLKNAHTLIDVYHSYFNPAYSEFISTTIDELESNFSLIEKEHFAQKTDLLTNFTIASQYKELIKDTDFQTMLEDFNHELGELNETSLNSQKSLLLPKLKRVIEEKKKSPHKKIGIIDVSEIEALTNEYVIKLERIISLITKISHHITNFKKPYRDLTSLKLKISTISTKIEELNFKKARIEQDADCRAYVEAQKNINTLEKEILSLQETLKADQSQYLNDYFLEINKIFIKLGSKNYTLERVTDNSGYMPVYSLKVKFHDIEINNQQLNSVFSESDRRALALSIFWSKINLKATEDKAKTIVILDDPVTSFDDNRITNSVNLFKESLPLITQMVILTHYPFFIRRFCEITKQSQINSKYIKISQNSTTSYLENINRDEFSDNDYGKMFHRIYGYINRQNSEPIKTCLRPFLENLYLPSVYAKQIIDKNVDCSTLENMIDGIFEDDAVKAKLHSFRNTLNPDSHLFTTSNDEDVRNFASEMIDYLFSIDHSN